mmetsp:Transcript_8070/g.20595  ORF Transcript_8070/g.20595 Transcript_8070/m.20595 type:complete len:271 (-) Transcript_8070:385-1197(-)
MCWCWKLRKVSTTSKVSSSKAWRSQWPARSCCAKRPWSHCWARLTSWSEKWTLPEPFASKRANVSWPCWHIARCSSRLKSAMRPSSARWLRQGPAPKGTSTSMRYAIQHCTLRSWGPKRSNHMKGKSAFNLASASSTAPRAWSPHGGEPGACSALGSKGSRARLSPGSRKPRSRRAERVKTGPRKSTCNFAMIFCASSRACCNGSNMGGEHRAAASAAEVTGPALYNLGASASAGSMEAPVASGAGGMRADAWNIGPRPTMPAKARTTGP